MQGFEPHRDFGDDVKPPPERWEDVMGPVLVDRSPDKASDAAALLVMLSQSSGGDDPGAAGPSATPLLGGAAKREPARPSVLLTAQHQAPAALAARP